MIIVVVCELFGKKNVSYIVVSVHILVIYKHFAFKIATKIAGWKEVGNLF